MTVKNNHRGMTLIELLIASFIIAMLGLGILSFQILLGKNQNIAVNSYLDVEESNKIVSDFVKEIRVAQYSENGSYPLESVTDNQIIFYSDINFDGTIDRVRYTLTGSTFYKGVIKPSGQPATYPSSSEIVTTLSDKIKNGSTPAFYYFNGDWPIDVTNNPLALSSRISQTRTVKIYLIINASSINAREDYQLESSSEIRILKDNI